MNAGTEYSISYFTYLTIFDIFTRIMYREHSIKILYKIFLYHSNLKIITLI